MKTWKKTIDTVATAILFTVFVAVLLFLGIPLWAPFIRDEILPFWKRLLE